MIIVLAVGLIAPVVIRAMQLAHLEERATDERAALLRTTREALTAQASSLLRLTALPLGWAVRSALLKDDTGSVDAYLQRIVQERHVTGAALVGTDGKVRLAGNCKLENRPAADVYADIALNEPNPNVVVVNDSVRVVVPVMGYDRRLGTQVLSYRSPKAADLEASTHPAP